MPCSTMGGASTMCCRYIRVVGMPSNLTLSRKLRLWTNAPLPHHVQDLPGDGYHDHWAYWASRDLLVFLLTLVQSA